MAAYRVCVGDAMEFAAKKVGVPNWQAYKWESVAGGHLLTGEVPDGVYTRGPRKGLPRFGCKGATNRQRVAVSDSELQAVAAEYEASTGNCWECKGSGQEWRGWSAAEGSKYGPCRRCDATGKATGAAS